MQNNDVDAYWAKPPPVYFVSARKTFGGTYTTRMWAIAQRDGRPAEYRWRPLFNAAKFG